MDKFIFGITGPTGSGKSTVSNLFRNLGVFVSDADVAARMVTKKSEACLDEIVETFGNGILTTNKELDRKALAKIVFSDSTKLKLLNNITHKHIKRYIEKEISLSDSTIIAIDGAVIIGSPVMEICKLLVVVTAEQDVRVRRIIKRDNIDLKMAEKRVASQMKESEYEEYADFIIKNNDESVRLEECVEDIYNKIKAISEKADTQTKTPQKN